METKIQIDVLGTIDSTDSISEQKTTINKASIVDVTFSDLKADPGRVSLESLLSESKLLCIRHLALPLHSLIPNVSILNSQQSRQF
jgi:hypothetical protein